jgi:FAD/FMN-containing dehydrogenase
VAHQYLSWGRVHRFNHDVLKPQWLSDLEHHDFTLSPKPILPFGLGRSYGDSCLNDDGVLIDMSDLKRMIAFDPQTGVLRCESGVSLAEIIEVFLPRGWFPPVVPGTKYVTVGGAIANDIHGKNHHRAGTFGCHIRRFELLRSNGKKIICDEKENAELYAATIGGLGLTGFITWADIQLKRVTSADIEVESIKMRSVDEFFELSEQSDADFEYTVAWIDVTAPRAQLGRGLFMRGRHVEGSLEKLAHHFAGQRPRLTVPIECPISAINRSTVKIFNLMYYHKQTRKRVGSIVDIDPFFFPLDGIAQWNFVYGRRGLQQYQFALPLSERNRVKDVLEKVRAGGFASFLSVLKMFGHPRSPGMLSFPIAGPTLTMDFPAAARNVDFFRELNKIVLDAGGKLYPAKDSQMDARAFARSFPQVEAFEKYKDPKFSSSFWRRVRPVHAK